MANSSRRVNSTRSDYYRGQSYISGNTVRKLDEMPQRHEPGRSRKAQPSRAGRAVSVSTQKNRMKATQMSRGYVMFLALISVITLFLCVSYLQRRAELTSQLQAMARQESELSTLKADNDALYNTVMASVDLESVKNTAINKLGMQYPTEEQIMTYDTAGNSYVRQDHDVPGTE